MTVILVCGGRDFGKKKPEYDFIFNRLDWILIESYKASGLEVVHGTAKGADTVGKEWGEYYGFDVIPFKPDISKYGIPVAFFVRNQEMAEYCYRKALEGDDVYCAAFNGGTGTNDMVKKIQRVNKSLSENKIIIKDYRNAYGVQD